MYKKLSLKLSVPSSHPSPPLPSSSTLTAHQPLLSVLSHPDKYKLIGNETREDADAKFVEITKAYKA